MTDTSAPTLLTLFALLTPSMAIAGTTVVHPSTLDDDTLSDWVDHDAREPREAVSLERFRSTEPVATVGFVSVETCATAPTGPGVLRQAAEDAERAALYGQYDEARAAIQRAELAMGCASSIVDAATVARVFQLRGVLAGDLREAEEAFRLAQSFAPTLGWNDNDLPDRRPVWDSVAGASGAEARAVRVLPTDSGLSIWVDGRRLETPALTSGRHFIQLEGAAVTSLWVDAGADAEPHVILVPRLLMDANLLTLSNPAGRSEWADVLALSSLRDSPVELLAEGTVYRWEPGTEDLREFDRYGTGKGARIGRLAGGIGGGMLAASGAVILGVSAQQADALEQDATGFRLTPVQAAERRESINRRTIVGYSFLTVGILGGGGLVLAFQDTAAGRGVSVSTSW